MEPRPTESGSGTRPGKRRRGPGKDRGPIETSGQRLPEPREEAGQRDRGTIERTGVVNHVEPPPAYRIGRAESAPVEKSPQLLAGERVVPLTHLWICGQLGIIGPTAVNRAESRRRSANGTCVRPAASRPPPSPWPRRRTRGSGRATRRSRRRCGSDGLALRRRRACGPRPRAPRDPD